MVVLSRSVYNRWLEARSGPGEAFVVKYGNRTGEFTPVAVVDAEPGSPLLSLGEDLIGMEIDQAAKFLRPETPRVNRIDIILKPNADIATAKEATVALVGPRAKVLTAKEQGRGTQQVIGGIQIGFTMCSIGAMVVGLFLVGNGPSWRRDKWKWMLRVGI